MASHYRYSIDLSGPSFIVLLFPPQQLWPMAGVWNGKDEDYSLEEKRGYISLEKSKPKGLDVKMIAMLACHVSKILLTKRYGHVVNKKSR